MTLPLLRPALAAGAGLAFITALGDFIVSIVLYTFDTRPISIEILSSLRLQDLGMAAAYGVLLMAASAAAFLLWGQGEADGPPEISCSPARSSSSGSSWPPSSWT